MSFADHFSSQSASYAAFRPNYPAAFIRDLAEACPGRGLAWDAGTGSGQAAVPLAAHFTRVEATDASAEQIRHATPHPRVRYRVADEGASGLPDASADLVAAAQAAHWFDMARFSAEADRVLRPGGLLAIWCYGLSRVDAAVDAAVREIYDGLLGPHWPPQRRLVDEGYRGLPFPYPELAAPPWAIEAELRREDFLGYLGTWSALARARRMLAADPWPEMARLMTAAWPEGSGSRRVVWPLSLRWGRKPA
jgi:SAM-dependent methyltransferase